MSEKIVIGATVCPQDQCAGCMACVSKCSRDAIHIVDNLQTYNAVIDKDRCVACGQCVAVCPNVRPVVKRALVDVRQGWANDDGVRQAASSGGAATAIALAFVQAGGVCCACRYDQGRFSFATAETVEDVRQFVGSKYVKSDPGSIYKDVQRFIKAGRKVLFIGLPCQVAAVKNYVGDHELLYTVDLICHGSPSPRLLEMYLKEMKRPIQRHKTISFRQKDRFFLAIDNKSVQPIGVFDRYTYAFLQGIDYTENCYSCQYASIDRVSDVTLGDSWGSKLDKQETGKGISLLLCQSDKGRKLLDLADMTLLDVDLEAAVKNNKQLNHPTAKTEKRELFYRELRKTNSFTKAVGKAYPKACFRFEVKSLLVKAGLLK